MSKRQIIIVLGIWIMAFLYLGFPSSWDKVLALVTGVALVFVAYSLKPEESKKPAEAIPYIEHKSEPPRSEPPLDITSINQPTV